MQIEFDQLIKVLGLVAGGGTGAILLKGLIEKKKTDAEAESIQIKGELAINEATLRYANELKEDISAMKEDYRQIEVGDKLKIERVRESLRGSIPLVLKNMSEKRNTAIFFTMYVFRYILTCDLVGEVLLLH